MAARGTSSNRGSAYHRNSASSTVPAANNAVDTPIVSAPVKPAGSADAENT